jgi:16S rRNA (guanine527-N7)-methyltransferase
MNQPQVSHISEESIAALLNGVISTLGLTLTERQREQLGTHFSLLLKWNARMNLTSVRDPEAIATRHFEESLFLAKLLPVPQGLMVDIGSGAGFPGLPLKIVWPGMETVLLEPNQKKASFLKEVVRSCGLEGIAIRAERLESVAKGELAGRVALATMRAVAPTLKALADMKRLLAKGGKVALFASGKDANLLPEQEGIEWRQSVAIPHSQQRIILIGHASAD